MAYITLDRAKLKHNYNFLNETFKENGIEWAVVSKILCGNRLFLEELLSLGVREVCDSRIENLKIIKEINPDVQTVFIKPPAPGHIEEIVRYADVTFNSETETITRRHPSMLHQEYRRGTRQSRKTRTALLLLSLLRFRVL